MYRIKFCIWVALGFGFNVWFILKQLKSLVLNSTNNNSVRPTVPLYLGLSGTRSLRLLLVVRHLGRALATAVRHLSQRQLLLVRDRGREDQLGLFLLSRWLLLLLPLLLLLRLLLLLGWIAGRGRFSLLLLVGVVVAGGATGLGRGRGRVDDAAVALALRPHSLGVGWGAGGRLGGWLGLACSYEFKRTN